MTEKMTNQRRAGQALSSTQLLMGLSLLLPFPLLAQEGGTETVAEPQTLETPLPERVEAVEQKLTALDEPLGVLQEDVKKLKGLRVSGYVQARYVHSQASSELVSTKDFKTFNPSNLDEFSIRRARLKATYTGTRWSEAMLQLDATGKGISLKDAEVTGILPLKDLDVRVTAGQSKVPFGFEIMQSSGDRELPERSYVIRQLFPGERDRGVKLAIQYKFLRANFGIYNGNGTEDTSTTFKYSEWTDSNDNGVYDDGVDSAVVKTSSALNFANSDRDARKDKVVRLGVDFDRVAAGVNYYRGYWGKFEDDGLVQANTTSWSSAPTVTYMDKVRMGIDFQTYLSLLPVGGTSLRGEYIQGKGVFQGTNQTDKDVAGYYLTLVQSVTPHFAVAARLDQFDPDTSAEGIDDTHRTLEPVLLWYPTGALKLSASYQLVSDFEATDDAGNKIDKANNQFTLQLQGRF